MIQGEPPTSRDTWFAQVALNEGPECTVWGPFGHIPAPEFATQLADNPQMDSGADSLGHAIQPHFAAQQHRNSAAFDPPSIERAVPGHRGEFIDINRPWQVGINHSDIRGKTC